MGTCVCAKGHNHRQTKVSAYRGKNLARVFVIKPLKVMNEYWIESATSCSQELYTSD